tara:strand:- start:7327 stop:8139 length:813 start_codon:yes stop_codon:yes gene_type:complete
MDRKEFEQEILKIRRSVLPDSMKEKLEREFRANFEMMQQSGATRDPETGLFRALDGRLYQTIEEVDRSNEELRRRQQLEETRGEAQEQLGELESLIRRSGAAQRQMAERVGARQTGQLLSQLERSILGAGGDAQALEALTPGVQERAERSLLDRLTGIEAQTAQQLQRVPQLALGQATTMAGLQQTQQQIQDQMARAIMGEETRRAQIQAELDSQPEWWESILGAAGTAIGTAVGGPVGGAIGGALTGAFTRQPQSTTTIGSSPVIYDSF